MSCPRAGCGPADGRSTPVSRLITVVLPAPLGPISAWRAPFSIASDTPLTAAMPPKCLSRPVVSSTTGMVSALRRRSCDAQCRNAGADGRARARARRRSRADALATDQHDHHQHEADPELPVLRGEVGDPVLHQLEQHRPDQPAIEIAGAADDEDQQQVGGALEGEHVERGECGGLRQQRAGDAGIDGGERVDRDQPRVDRDADRGGAQRIALHRAQRQAERRVDDAPREQEENEQHGEAVDVGDVAEDIELEVAEHRRDHDALQAVGAAGDVGIWLAISRRIRATPSVTIRRVRSEPRSTRKLVAKPSTAAARPETTSASTGSLMMPCLASSAAA